VGRILLGEEFVIDLWGATIRPYRKAVLDSRLSTEN
jgi:hypothetical protein